MDTGMREYIRKVKDGDIQAFNRVVVFFQQRLRMFVAGILLDKARVDDVAQEIFITAYNKIDLFDNRKPFYPWLCGIARNVIYNENRKFMNRSKAEGALVEFQLAENETEAGIKFISDLSVFLEECLNALPGNIRRIVDAFYDRNLTSAEIAGEVRRKASDIRIILMRTRIKLKECVQARVEANR